MAKRHLPAWLSLGFRPFFLAAALWAALALAVWMIMLTQGLALPSRFDPLTWHIHEMLFGFVMAAIGGFLLTAVPNWTGRAPMQGIPLAGLATLWLLGRVACLTSQMWPLWFSVSADLAFAITLSAVNARELIAGSKLRNLLTLLPLGVLTIANLLIHMEAAGYGVPAGLGWRLGLAAILVLVSVIGGRIIPAFTRNWLAKRMAQGLPMPHKMLNRLALGTLHTGLLIWAFLPGAAWVGGLLLLAAFFNALRLWEWKGLSTTKFDQLVADGRLPKAKQIDGRKVWDIRELDPAFDELGSIDNSWDDLGCSEHEIAAITGHRSLQEVRRYTEAAQQVILARRAMDAILGPDGEQNLANSGKRLAKKRSK